MSYLQNIFGNKCTLISHVLFVKSGCFLIGLVTFQQSIQIELRTERYADSPDFLPIYLSANRSVAAS